MLDLSVEKRVSSNTALASVVLSIVGILGTAVGFFGFMGGLLASSPLGAIGAGGLLLASLFLGMVGTILQLIVVYQWGGALNTNLANLRLLIQHLVALASVLAVEPELLLLDDPFVGLDPASAARVWDILHTLSRGGSSVVCALHRRPATHGAHSIHRLDRTGLTPC